MSHVLLLDLFILPFIQLRKSHTVSSGFAGALNKMNKKTQP